MSLRVPWTTWFKASLSYIERPFLKKLANKNPTSLSGLFPIPVSTEGSFTTGVEDLGGLP